MFAALTLARAGARPIVLERGKAVPERQRDVESFWRGGRLQKDSNVQFGEGGAGTFSDGKLMTGIKKDMYTAEVFRELTAAGAPEEILYLAKPHLGTGWRKSCRIFVPKLFLSAANTVFKTGWKICWLTMTV